MYEIKIKIKYEKQVFQLFNTYPIGPKFNETINTTANKNIAFFLLEAFSTFDN